MSSIIEDGSPIPIFRVQYEDHRFDGNWPSSPWTMVLEAVENRKAELNFGERRVKMISGADTIGLSHPVVRHNTIACVSPDNAVSIVDLF
jgi:hypothetical protein